jgi:nucleolar protein 56
MHYLTVSVAGLFVFNEKNKLLKHVALGKKAEEIAEKLNKFDSGKEFKELTELKKEFKDLVTEQPNQATDYFKKNFRKIVLDINFVKNDVELNKLINSVLIEKSKLKISKIERRDKLVIQTVSALNDMEKILNTMSERLREWYGLHYPELDISDHEKFAAKIAELGNREKFEKFTRSMGMELKEEDVKMLQNYAKSLKSLYILKAGMEKYLEAIVPVEMPNLNALLGSTLTARILALAGSLEKLAKMPSSAIQLLGAEKSLFRFLKDKKIKRPPKFGLLFTHPDISGSKKELQGKIARLLSSKLTIAARADFYSKKDISEELVNEYKEKLKRIWGEK